MSANHGVLRNTRSENPGPTSSGCLMSVLTLLSSTCLSVTGGIILIAFLHHH